MSYFDDTIAAPPSQKPCDEEVGSPSELSDQPVTSEGTPRTTSTATASYRHRVAGHHRLLMGAAGRVLKITDSTRECQFYVELAERARQDVGVAELLPFVPRFFGANRLHVPNAVGAPVTIQLELEDLCFGYVHPCIIDLKMGVRQYGLHPTEDKRRSKNDKAHRSTTSRLGVRLGGMRLCDKTGHVTRERSNAEGLAMSVRDFTEEVRAFLSNAAPWPSSTSSTEGALRHGLHTMLQRLRSAMEEQRTYHFFTTSLLWMYDATRPDERYRMAIIDFAHTHTSDERPVRNPDEGYLRGLDSLIAIVSRAGPEDSVRR